MKRILITVAAALSAAALYAQDYHIVLWDNSSAPTSNGITTPEVETKPGQVKNTSSAEMWIYKAGEETLQVRRFCSSLVAAMRTCPWVTDMNEAKWFASIGVTAAVVNISSSEWSP